MPRIIFISPHFKSGRGSAAHLSYLVRYIATREGVAPVADADRLKPATGKQERLIRQLVKDLLTPPATAPTTDKTHSFMTRQKVC